MKRRERREKIGTEGEKGKKRGEGKGQEQEIRVMSNKEKKRIRDLSD
jgi:hypothetical protein